MNFPGTIFEPGVGAFILVRQSDFVVNPEVPAPEPPK